MTFTEKSPQYKLGVCPNALPTTPPPHVATDAFVRPQTQIRAPRLPASNRSPKSAPNIKSLIFKNLVASPMFPRLYADTVLHYAPNSLAAKILAPHYKKIVAYTERTKQLMSRQILYSYQSLRSPLRLPLSPRRAVLLLPPAHAPHRPLPRLPHPPRRPPRGRRVHPGRPHGNHQRPAARHHRNQARRTHPPRPQHRRPQHPPRPLRTPPRPTWSQRSPTTPPRPSNKSTNNTPTNSAAKRNVPNPPAPAKRSLAEYFSAATESPHSYEATRHSRECSNRPNGHSPSATMWGQPPPAVQAAQKYRAAAQRHRSLPKPKQPASPQ